MHEWQGIPVSQRILFDHETFTVALDILQGEDTCFYSTLLPTLEILMAKTHAVKNGLSKMTGELPDIIVKAIKSRFAVNLDSKDVLLAAFSLSKFKLCWVSEKPRKDYIKFLLTTKCSSLSEEPPARTLILIQLLLLLPPPVRRLFFFWCTARWLKCIHVRGNRGNRLS